MGNNKEHDSTSNLALWRSDPWSRLRDFTTARIAVGRAGSSLPTGYHLEFQFAHARARDAVWVPLEQAELKMDLQQRLQPLLNKPLQISSLASQAHDRAEYLTRPDKGRKLNPTSVDTLTGQQCCSGDPKQPRIAIVIADGLSPVAIHHHAAPFLEKLYSQISLQYQGLNRISVVEQGRVAIGDQIGEFLQADMVLILIGERPGLSSPDSMGIYMTYAPKSGRQDAERNCISNIHKKGLDYDTAAARLIQLMQRSFQAKLSGVQLKDESQLIEQRPSNQALLKQILLQD